MRNIRNILIVLVLFFISSDIFSQGSYTPSEYNFMNLNGSGVTCRSGKYYLDGHHQYMTNPNFDYSYFTTVGINPEDHSLITQQGTDPHTGNLLQIIPDGENKVIKLGNDRTNYGYPGHAQDISYVFDVDPLYSILLLKFAVVFQEAPDHNMENKAYFSVRVSDVNNHILEDCAEYEVSALAGIDGFVNGPGGVLWRDWSTIGIDLSRYAGNKVKVTFTSKGCRQGEHFGYAYYNVKCVRNSIEASECNGSSITLTAPAHFASYSWSLGGYTSQEVTYPLPANGELSVSCHLVSFTGCELDLMATVLNNTSYSGEVLYYEHDHCVGTSFEMYGFNIPASELSTIGDYTFINTVIGYNNCEDATSVILTLHVVDEIHVDYVVSICEDQGLNAWGWNIQNPTPGLQVYQHHDYSYKGCDSITTLRLTTYPMEMTIVNDTVCQGEYYNFHGTSINTQVPGLVTNDYHAYTSQGCDHTFHLNLIVNPVYDSTIYDAICEGDVYISHNFNVNPQGTGTFNYVKNETTVNGCDSIVHLSLTVWPVVENTINAEICQGESYTDYGFNVITPSIGNHPNIQTLNGLSTSHGCDSIVHLNLVVNDVIVENINATISYGENYQNAYFSFINPPVGVIDSTLHLTTQSGCEHTVNLHLVVNQTYNIHIYDSICYGEEYHSQANNFHITQILPAGDHTFYQYLHTIAQADSTMVLHLTVNPTYSNVIEDQICYGNDYSQHGFTVLQPQEGLYSETHNLTTSEGCDSIVTLNLNVLSNLESFREASICDGEDYNDDLFHISGIGLAPGPHQYQETLTSVSGCDSVVTLNLTVGQHESVYINDYACQYDVYNNHGFYIELMDSIPHEYRDTLYLTSINGCDSTVYLNVGTAPVEIVRYQAEMCYGGSFSGFGFNVDNPAPDHYVIRRNVYIIPGMPCPDTIHELTLDVWPLVDSLLYDTICEGENYYRNGFYVNAPSPGLYQDTLNTLSMHGCDSTVYLNLTINPLLERHINLQVCEHDHFSMYGFDIPDVQMNEPLHTMVVPSAITGCDSTVYLNLTVNDILYNSINASICLGDTYSHYGFNVTPTSVGVYRDTIWSTSHSGCDSLACLALHVNPVYDHSIEASIGEGSSYHVGAFNIQYPPVGLHHYDTVLHSIYGCDSIVHLNLSVFETYGINIDTIICYGDDYINNDFQIYDPEVGDYQYNVTYPTIHGVDSTIYLNLHVKPVYSADTYGTICQGDDYYNEPFLIINPPVGVNYYDTTLYTIYSCDSIITLALDVKPTYDTLITTFIGTGYDYVENGFELIQPDEGSYDLDTLYNSINGCDSIVRLHLDVYLTKQTYIYDSICYGEDYVINGFNKPGLEVGTYYDTLHLYTIHNVDSTVYLTLDVNEVYDYTFFEAICHEESYIDHNFQLLAPAVGHYDEVQQLQTIKGCDSIVRLSLEVNPTYSHVILDSVCYGDSYRDYDQNFFVNTLDEIVGLYQDTLNLTSIAGCDSVIYLHLDINPVYDIAIVDTICHKESYTQYGFNIDTPDAGVFNDTLFFSTTSGCDSTLYLDLLVWPHYDTLINVEICHGFDYVDNGFEFLQPEVGTHKDTLFLTTIHGCDSTVAIQLEVYPTYDTYILDSICFDEDYMANGFVEIFPPVGVTHDTLWLESIHGCDSTVYLHLDVYPTFQNWFDAAICEGEEYHEWGFDEVGKAVGMHYDTLYLSTVHGCDSISYLELTVNPTHTTLLEGEICEGEDYTDNGFDILQPAPGDSIYSITLPNEFGCDSTVYLALTVWPKSYRYLVDTVCHGVDYLLNGFKIIQAEVGIAYDTLYLTNSHGCDSTVFMELTVLPEYDTTYVESICYGDDYDLHGFNYIMPEVGHYIDTLMLLTTDGCDSIIYLDLTVNEVYDTLFIDMICQGEDYTQHGFDIIQPAVGFHQDTLWLTTTQACDSLILLNLTVAERADTLIIVDLCEGEDYVDNGFEYLNPAVGVYHDSLSVPPVVACDSMVYLLLTVHDMFVTNILDTICEGDDYMDNGFVVMQPVSGEFFDTLRYVTQSGCDSIVALDLTVNPRYDITILDTVCYIDSLVYTDYGFMIDSLYVGTIYDTLNLENIYGCDSIVMLELTVNPRHDITILDTICYADDMTYNYYGFQIDSLVVGTMYDTLNLTNEYGCDSIVMLELTVNPRHDIAIFDTICYEDGLAYTEYGFQIDSLVIGKMYDSMLLTNEFGCDSVVTLELVVNPRHDISITDTICYADGATYTEYGFEIDSIYVGTIFDTLNLENIYGCDSIVALELVVNPRHDIVLTDTICEGEDYTLNGFEFLNPVAGLYFDTLNLTNGFGCDSVVTLELTVNPRHEIALTDTICEGEDYTLNGFEFLNPSAGIYFDTLNLVNEYGCDSIVSLALTVGAVDTTAIVAEACQWGGYHENGFDLDSLQLGILYDTLWLTSIYGCDSLVTLELTVNVVNDTLFTDTICAGLQYTNYGFDFLVEGEGLQHDTLWLTNAYGCDSLVRLDLFVYPRYEITFNEEICEGYSYEEHGFSYILPEPGTYFDTLNFQTINGCDSILMLELWVHPLQDSLIRVDICYGESYEGNGFIYNNPEVGEYTDSLVHSDIFGCDSTVFLNLYVHELYDITILDSICEGDDYTLNGFQIINPAVGMAYDTLWLQSIWGCDSVVKLELKILPILIFDGEMTGTSLVYAATNMQTGRYEYDVPSVEHCEHYAWSIEPAGCPWILEPDSTHCTLWVTTEGNYEIKVKIGNMCHWDSLTMPLWGSFFGQEELLMEEALIYPNPTKSQVTIELEGMERIIIQSLAGQIMRKEEYDSADRVVMELESLPRGSYIVTVETKRGKSYKQIIVER